MAMAGGVVAAAAVTSSGYRVKFKKPEFLELVQIAAPSIIYRRGRMHFFSYDGFVMYCYECRDEDFTQKVLNSIEFSNVQWSA